MNWLFDRLTILTSELCTAVLILLVCVHGGWVSARLAGRFKSNHLRTPKERRCPACTFQRMNFMLPEMVELIKRLSSKASNPPVTLVADANSLSPVSWPSDLMWSYDTPSFRVSVPGPPSPLWWTLVAMAYAPSTTLIIQAHHKK